MDLLTKRAVVCGARTHRCGRRAQVRALPSRADDTVCRMRAAEAHAAADRCHGGLRLPDLHRQAASSNCSRRRKRHEVRPLPPPGRPRDVAALRRCREGLAPRAGLRAGRRELLRCDRVPAYDGARDYYHCNVSVAMAQRIVDFLAVEVEVRWIRLGRTESTTATTPSKRSASTSQTPATAAGRRWRSCPRARPPRPIERSASSASSLTRTSGSGGVHPLRPRRPRRGSPRARGAVLRAGHHTRGRRS